MRHKFLAAITAAAATALMSTAVAAPSAAAPRALIHYVALGDGYSSGLGAGDYLPNDCRRSRNAYPWVWVEEHRPASFVYAACAGAATVDVAEGQVPVLNRNTTLVTVTVGAADADFAGVVRRCVVQPVNPGLCDEALGFAESVIRNGLPPALAETYRRIRQHAPNARVVVAGYPHLFDAATECTAATREHRVRINKMVDDADALIETQARAAGFRFADVRQAFHGHEVCAPGGPDEEWILRIEHDGASYHPNATGQRHGYLPPVSAAIA
ncbi:SGNH/GDSL hydrolase family protein [Streptomyces sp. NPDC001288]|uniref:SGNH/GDSL hydrolase family protein n=1 Tax=unclassified Streptomyces TaxID=2593676 RepID=UPI00332A8781